VVGRVGRLLRDHEDGLTVASGPYTAEQAVRDWLAFGCEVGTALDAANVRRVPADLTGRLIEQIA
jgi:hypothetical protein